jgi:drug/metabolite transporter (DMT)-like permease
MPGRPRLRARLMLLGSALAFAVMAVLARLLSRPTVPAAARFDAGQLTVIRFAMGAAISLAVFRLRPGLYRPFNRRLLWSRGISGGIVVVLYFLALQRIPAGEAGMLFNLFPVIAVLLSMVAFGERPTLHLLFALLVATVGVVLVLGGGSLRIDPGAGEALALAAAFFAAISAVTIRAMRGTDNAPTIFFYFCLGGMPVALPFALGAWPTEPRAWLLGLAMGLASYVAQVFMTEAYGALSVPEAAGWLQLTPIAQVVLGGLVLGEAVTPLAIGGAVLGVAGVAWGTVYGRRGVPAPPVPAP